MFRGSSHLSIDSKGRIAIPTKLRDAISADHSGEMILTIDHVERCLVLYTMSKWIETEQNLMDLPNLASGVRDMKRLIVGHAIDVEMDGQGRLMLAAHLREYANLDKKIALVGQGRKFEIWDEDSWVGNRDLIREQAPENIKNDPNLQGLSI